MFKQNLAFSVSDSTSILAPTAFYTPYDIKQEGIQLPEQRFSFYRRFFITYMLLHTGAYVLWLHFWNNHSFIQVIGGDIFSVTGFLVPSLVLCIGCTRKNRTDQRFWLLMLLATLFNVIAESIWSYYDIILKQEYPFPGWADVFYCLATLCYFIGVLYLTNTPRDKTSFSRATFDIIIVMITALIISGYYIIEPIYRGEHASLLSMAVSIFYPIGDLGIFFGLLRLFTAEEILPLSRKALCLISLSFFLFIIMDSIYLYLQSRNLYYSGSLFDPVWTLAVSLIGLSSFYRHSPQKEIVSTKSPGKPKWYLLPLLSMLVLIFLLLSHAMKIDIIFIGISINIILLLIRQYLVMKDNNRLMEQLTKTKNDLERSNAKLRETVAELQKTSALREEEARTDFLTGLLNRRYIMNMLEDLQQQAHREGIVFSLMLLDVDHFKTINDQYGHDIGDLVLTRIPEILRKCTRKTDILGRFGGEEFIVILPETDLSEAKQISERIRIAVSEEQIMCQTFNIVVTISIGVTTWKANDTYETLYRRADKGLYEAKYAGRNQMISVS